MPIDQFKVLFQKIRQDFPDAEFFLLIQKAFENEVQDPRIVSKYPLPEGKILFKDLSEGFLKELSHLKPDLFIIPSNNPTYSGYSEIVRIGMHTGAKKILFIDENFRKRALSRLSAFLYLGKEYGKNPGWKTRAFEGLKRAYPWLKKRLIWFWTNAREGGLPYSFDEVRKYFTRIGYPPVPFRIEAGQFKEYLSKAAYPPEKVKKYGNYFLEKSLEHFLSLQFHSLNSESKIIDIAAANSPFADIVHRIFGCKVYSNDLVFKKGVTPLNDWHVQIGSDACHLPIENDVFDLMTLHCSFEMFREDQDIKLVREAARVLKKNGKMIILPLYMNEVFHNLRDPLTQEDPLPRVDKGAKLVYRKNYHGVAFARCYSVQALYERIIRNLKGMSLKICEITNGLEISPEIYIRWIAVFEKA